MKSQSLILAVLLVCAPVMAHAQQPKKLDAREAARFCDIGFRFVQTGVQWDLEKLAGSKLTIDPKVLQAVSSQAALEIAALTYICRMVAAGLLPPGDLSAAAMRMLQYAFDLQAAAAKADPAAGPGKPAVMTPDVPAKATFGITIESAIKLDDNLTVVLKQLATQYLCTCRAGKAEG